MNLEKNRTNILNLKKIVKIILPLFLLLINSIIAAYIFETLWSKSFSDTFYWICKSPDLFLCSVIIIFIFQLGIFCIFNSVFISGSIANALLFILGIINYFKYDLRGEVFSFSDISLFRESLQVVGEFELNISLIVVISFSILFLVSLFLKFINKQLKLKFTLPLAVRCCFAIIGIILCSQIINIGLFIYKADTVDTVFFQINDYYSDNGLMAGIFRTFPTRPTKPENYSKNTLTGIFDNVTTEDNQSQLPNIIFIMNESYYDINALDEITLSEEPMQLFKNYQQDFSMGYFLTPSYGGGTSQVEFEVITGYPSNNVSGTAYTDYISKPIDSIVSVANNSGYDTYSFHPYLSSFYKRDTVYSFLGFNHKYFEPEFNNLSTLYYWPDDYSLYENIINVYENRNPDSPFFAYVTTTQNHGGYAWDFPEEYQYINVETDNLDDSQFATLNTYSNLLYYSDLASDYLLNYFSEISEPTIIVMFGDHAPDLSQFGIDVSYEPEDFIKFHTTPLLIWNNYNLPAQNIGYISAYRLGAYILSMAGISNDPYINMLSDENFPNYTSIGIIASDKTLTSSNECSDSDMASYSDMWMVEYDRIFGKNHYSNIIK